MEQAIIWDPAESFSTMTPVSNAEILAGENLARKNLYDRVQKISTKYNDQLLQGTKIRTDNNNAPFFLHTGDEIRIITETILRNKKLLFSSNKNMHEDDIILKIIQELTVKWVPQRSRL